MGKILLVAAGVIIFIILAVIVAAAVAITKVSDAQLEEMQNDK